jgi:NAD(P)-dependent dehydrogenase (short-subunit alcohol dehydrogenase family)
VQIATLSGRQAVLTGAAGGIGSAIARELIAQGATVHGLDRDRARLQLLAQESGGRLLGHPVDLTDRAESDRVFRQLAAALGGRCDILVNNAGISRIAPFPLSDDALLDLMLAANFTAAFRLTRALLPALRSSRHASIVNISSELALLGQSGYSAYSASKGALLAWSRTLAVELAGEGIRVNAVCPGPIDTPMIEKEFAGASDPQLARAEEIALVPLGRLGAAPDVAAVVGFLVGDGAAFVSGAAWSVDGGKTAR